MFSLFVGFCLKVQNPLSDKDVVTQRSNQIHQRCCFFPIKMNGGMYVMTQEPNNYKK